MSQRARSARSVAGAAWRHFGVGVSLFLLSCSGAEPPVDEGARPAPSLEVARIVAVANARGSSRAEARAALEEDVRLAELLRRTDPDRAELVTRLALGRALVSDLARRAREAGPPTDDEIRAVSERRWWEFDRPRLARVIHAVVLSSEPDAGAERLARQVAEAVADATSAAAFRKAAEAVTAEGFSLKVEELPPVDPAGRAFDPERPPRPGSTPRTFDPDFARAASALENIGDKSPVVRTKFGYHVLMLTGSVPALEVDWEKRRSMLHDEIIRERGRALAAEVLASQRRAANPEVERAALDLTARLGELVR